MTGPTETPRTRAGAWLDAAWRAQAAERQREVLPDGPVTLTCAARVGSGGLGRHLQELQEALAGRSGHVKVLSGALEGRGGLSTRARVAAARPLARVSASWRNWRANVDFDARAASELAPGDGILLAFSGQALLQMQRGRELGFPSLQLVSPTAHAALTTRRLEEALKRYPLEGSWASRTAQRAQDEYGLAERIYVSSQLVHDSFTQAGIAAERLARFPLTPAARFAPAPTLADSGTFGVVYCGQLTVAKGVPLLIDAIRRLPYDDLRLTLVGGSGSRGMRRHIARACAADPRISARPGDPLEHLRRARLYVQPSYSDGFGYAPVEALACGVPVLVSADTGMAELLRSDADGLVLPTGDLDALTEAIDASYRREAPGA